jgi:hypothetical protein
VNSSEWNNKERLAHELLFAAEELSEMRRLISKRLERIALVVRDMDGLLPSTVDSILRITSSTAEHGK